MKYPFITLLGPTATGKTKFAALLADTIGAEIISADSRQVYKGMDIGSGKDIAIIRLMTRFIPYHLIDIAEAGTEFNVFQYQQAAYQAIENIRKRNKISFLRRKWMYIEALLKGYKLFRSDKRQFERTVKRKVVRGVNGVISPISPFT